MKVKPNPRVVALGSTALLVASLGFAQTSSDDSSEVFELSPFVVEAEEGWVATESLAGSRLKTAVKDIAAPIEVMTKDFMDEFALNSIAEATIYSTNIEGVGDNLEDATGLGTGTGWPPPTRVRGLGNATLSRDFFAVRMGSDNYNLERVTIASGPNNLLFGTGSPSGVIDTSLKRASFEDKLSFGVQFDSHGSQRYNVDANQVLLEDKLAIHVSLLHSEKEYNLSPSGQDNTRAYLALLYKPTEKTSVSVNFENADVVNISPQLLLPWDQATPWFNASTSGFTGPGMTVDQPGYANPSLSGSWVGSTINNTIFGRNNNNPVFVTGSAGSVGGSTYNYNNTAEVRSPRFYPSTNPLNNEADGYTLLDSTYYPESQNLSGLTRREEVNSRIANLFVTHQFSDNLSLEVAAQKEEYEGWIGGFGGYIGGNTLKVDPNLYLTDGVTPNPNFGKYYIQGDIFRQNDLHSSTDWRVSLSYEKDFTKDGSDLWRAILGKQRLAGLVSANRVETKSGEYNARIIPQNGVDPVINGLTLQPTNVNGWANHASRTLNVRYYFEDYQDTPVAPHYDDITGPFTYADSNGQSFTIDMLDTGLTDSFGRRLGPHRTNTLIKSKLDTRQLAYQGFFWQNRLVATLGWRHDSANGANPANGAAAADVATGLRPILADIDFEPFDDANEASGNTTTKGVVVRPFHRLVELPFKAELDFAYNTSNTFQPDVSNRDPYGFRVKGATGEGEDKKVTLGLFEGKFRLTYNDFVNTAGPARAGNVPYNRFRFTANGIISRVNNLAFGQGNVAIDPAFPDMWPALGGGDPYWVTSQQKATGDEWTLDWKVTKNFDLRFNMNSQTVVESEIGTDWWAFLDTYLPVWQSFTFPEGGVNDPRDLDGNGTIDTWTWETAWRADNNTQTLANWWEADAVQGSTGINIIQGLDGKSNDFIRSNRYNVNWVYRFNDGKLKGFSVGGALRHRAAPLLSYGKKTVPSGEAFDLSSAFYGKDENYVDLSLNYRAKTELFGLSNYRIGLNIRNVLDDAETYTRLVNVSGEAIRAQRVSEPRTFILSLSADM